MFLFITKWTLFLFLLFIYYRFVILNVTMCIVHLIYIHFGFWELIRFIFQIQMENKTQKLCFSTFLHTHPPNSRIKDGELKLNNCFIPMSLNAECVKDVVKKNLNLLFLFNFIGNIFFQWNLSYSICFMPPYGNGYLMSSFYNRKIRWYL